MNQFIWREKSKYSVDKILETKSHIFVGPVHILTSSSSCLTKEWIPFWAVFDAQECKLNIYSGEEEVEVVEEIDVGCATFNYDLENSQNGEFKLW